MRLLKPLSLIFLVIVQSSWSSKAEKPVGQVTEANAQANTRTSVRENTRDGDNESYKANYPSYGRSSGLDRRVNRNTEPRRKQVLYTLPFVAKADPLAAKAMTQSDTARKIIWFDTYEKTRSRPVQHTRLVRLSDQYLEKPLGNRPELMEPHK